MSPTRDDSDNILFELFSGEPIQLRWGAWVTDSYLLQREGWKFHANEYEDHYDRSHTIKLAVTSPDKYVVLSGSLRLRKQDLLAGSGFYREQMMQTWTGGGLRHTFQMQQFTARDVFREIPAQEFVAWENMTAVDVMQATYANRRQMYMGDFKFFKELRGEDSGSEIYIPPDTVDDLFNKILAIQYPEQQKIKKGLIMPDAKPIIQAKIFSLVA